jgi:uncharacterized membrane protein
MTKSRLEAFSDGIFAIVITLLVLEIRLPETDYSNLPAALRSILPKILAYVMSFAIIGLYWVFHHYTLNFIKQVDGMVLWINILFLLFISFLPFPTIIMGRYPFQTLSVVMYGANLLLINATGFASIIHLRRNKHLSSALFTDVIYKSQIKLYLIVNFLYVAAIALAFFLPSVSYCIVAAMAIWLILRSVLLTKTDK